MENTRDDVRMAKAESYGFASMGTVASAHALAAKHAGFGPYRALVSLAPEPRDIVRVCVYPFLLKHC